jgi:dienelactone hydrolase
MDEKRIEYTVSGTLYRGYLAVDPKAGAGRPGILVAPDGLGLGENAMAVARRLAGLGYVAFAMDYYGDGQLPPSEQVGSRIGALSADPLALRSIAAEALKVLAGQPQTDPARLAAIGYCFGGTTAFELARSGADIKAAVGFHAGLRTARPQDAGQIRAKVLALIGATDPIVPPEDRIGFEQEMSAGGVDWRLYLYGGVGHSFTNPSAKPGDRVGMAYDAKTDKRSWAEMLALMDEVFETA